MTVPFLIDADRAWMGWLGTTADYVKFHHENDSMYNS